MHVIYHCVAGCNCSATAAAIHLNLLPMDKKPSYHDLINIPFYNNMLEKDKGKIIFRGIDENGHKVYTLCRKYMPHILLPTILDLWEALGGNKDEILIVNTQYFENRVMSFSHLLGKLFKNSQYAKKLAVKGTLKSYEKIANTVRETKIMLNNLNYS